MTHSPKLSTLLLIVLTTFAACSNSSYDSTSSKIDYSTLNEIPVTLDLEIIETEEYLPGELSDVIVDDDGTIIVADRQASIAIDQFDKDGNYVGRIAHEGNGPGEIQRYFSINDLKDDGFMVNVFPDKVLFFEKNDQGVYNFVESQVQDKSMERRIIVGSKFKSGEYFANSSRLIMAPDVKKYNQEDYFFSPISVINKQGDIIVDSLFMIKRANMHMTSINNGFRINEIPYLDSDQFEPIGDGTYIIARPDSNTITFFGEEHQVTNKIIFNVTPRPVTSEDLDFEFDDMDPGIRSEIENRVPEYKPPYLQMWATSTHILFLVNESETGKELVLINYDGTPVGKFMIPAEDDVEYFTGKELYTVHNDLEIGDIVRRYLIDF